MINELPLEFYLSSLADTLEKTADEFNHAMTNTNDALKIRSLCQITGELSGAIAFMHDNIEREIKNRKAKKFWQFWK